MLHKYTVDYVVANADTIDWKDVCRYAPLDTLKTIIEIFPEEISWYVISRFQSLTEEFIEEFADKLVWYYMDNWENISKEFRKKHKNRLSFLHNANKKV